MKKQFNRRDFLRATFTGAAAIAMGGSVALAAKTKTLREGKMNIILIMADDIGFECFGCYGSEQYKTPNIDKMAANGIKFTHCYAQPLCTPSRVKIMTGQSNIRNYVNFSILDKTEKTFGHMLQDHGYKTVVAGKWQLYGAEHYGSDIRGKGVLPKNAGFDECYLWQVEKLGERYWGPLLNINGQNKQFPASKYGPMVCCDHIIDFIRRHKEQPYFVYFPMILVHNPFPISPDSADPNSTNKQSNFSDMVTYMDKLIGRIVQAVKTQGQEENTLIMFVGDNGTNTGIRSELDGVIIRGAKGSTTDYGTRVPFVATMVGNHPGGKVCDDLVDFSDFMPTIAQATGATLPTGVTLDGQSFMPQLMGKNGKPRGNIFMYYNPRPTSKPSLETRFARDKRWKLYGDGKLYDVQNDVMEQSPIFQGQGSAKAQAARVKLQAVIDSMPAEPIKIAK